MNADDQAILRLEGLLSQGAAVLATSRPDSFGLPLLDSGAIAVWRARARHFLQSLLGETHNYAKDFEAAGEERATRTEIAVEQQLGVLRAILSDARDGHLFTRIRTLVSAELLADFVEQADRLIASDYIHAAASVSGAVLENGLRQIAVENNIKVKRTDEISALTQKCADKGVLTRLEQNQIRVWAQIRNSADHGQFDEVRAADVKAMHSGVQTFLAAHLT